MKSERNYLRATIAMAVVLFTMSARADVLYSTLGPNNAFDPDDGYIVSGGSGGQVIAGRFTVNDTAMLSNAMLGLSHFQGVNTPVNVFIESDAGGMPGSILATLTQVGTVPPFPTQSLTMFTSGSSFILTVGVTYWLVAQETNTGTAQVWNLAYNDAEGTFAHNLTDSATGPWFVEHNAHDVAFQINGTVVPGVLYDQYDHASGGTIIATNLSDAPQYTTDVADDFIVPAGQIWTVRSVDAEGRYFNGSGPAFSFNVFFYADSGTLPGVPIYSATNQPFTQAGGTFTVNLTTPAVLPARTYWVEVQANSSITNGEWGWNERTVQWGNGAAEQNPGGGFGSGCLTWTRKTTCSPGSTGPDQVFRLNGERSVTSECTVCHKHTQTITLPCSSMDYRRHLDHGDSIGACPPAKKTSAQTESLGLD